MPVLRRLLVAFAVVASVAGFASSRAHAILLPPLCNPPLTEVVSTAHFNVWYDADPTQSDYITQTDAGNLAASAEQAYSTYAALGYPPPVGGGTVDINVIDLSTWSLGSYYCFGSFDFHSGIVGQPNEAFSVGFDVFAEIELGLYTPSTYS